VPNCCDGAEVAKVAKEMRWQEIAAWNEQEDTLKCTRHEEIVADTSVEFSGKVSSKSKADLQ